MRLGWYVRLCIVLSLWWLPIGAYWLEHSDWRERTNLVISSADICYRATWNVPINRFNTEWNRCYNQSKNGFARIEADNGDMWKSSFGLALAICALGWLVALLLYWSARFILAGKRTPV